MTTARITAKRAILEREDSRLEPRRTTHERNTTLWIVLLWSLVAAVVFGAQTYRLAQSRVIQPIKVELGR